LLTENPMLLRMKELETVEKVAASGKLNIVLGEKGLTERVINLL
jgi:RNA-binding protein YhbY